MWLVLRTTGRKRVDLASIEVKVRWMIRIVRRRRSKGRRKRRKTRKRNKR
jgi:hypothetical protein